MIRHNASKEGFNAKNGNSLKAFRTRERIIFRRKKGAEEGFVFRSF
jgi:hypothetical protein